MRIVKFGGKWLTSLEEDDGSMNELFGDLLAFAGAVVLVKVKGFPPKLGLVPMLVSEVTWLCMWPEVLLMAVPLNWGSCDAGLCCCCVVCFDSVVGGCGDAAADPTGVAMGPTISKSVPMPPG